MTKDLKIADNPTAKEITEKISAIDSFEALYRFISFTKKLFPKLFYRYHLCIQLITRDYGVELLHQ